MSEMDQWSVSEVSDEEVEETDTLDGTVTPEGQQHAASDDAMAFLEEVCNYSWPYHVVTICNAGGSSGSEAN